MALIEGHHLSLPDTHKSSVYWNLGISAIFAKRGLACQLTRSGLGGYSAILRASCSYQHSLVSGKEPQNPPGLHRETMCFSKRELRLWETSLSDFSGSLSTNLRDPVHFLSFITQRIARHVRVQGLDFTQLKLTTLALASWMESRSSVVG